MTAGRDKTLQGQALGFVETMGLVTAVVVADAMGKAAQVAVRTVLNADAGLISVVCEGGLGACQAAVAAGRGAAEAMGGFKTANLIPRPFEDTGDLVVVHAGSMFRPKARKTAQAVGGTGAVKKAPAAKKAKPAKAPAKTGRPKGSGRKRTKG